MKVKNEKEISNTKEILYFTFKNKKMIIGMCPFHVRMLPPLGVMPESQWPAVFEIVERAMAKVHAESPAKAASGARPMVKPYKKS